MKTKKEYGKKKVSGKKNNSRLKNKKRTRVINKNSLRGGGNTVLKDKEGPYIPPFKRGIGINSRSIKKNTHIPPDYMFTPRNYTSDIYRDLTKDEADIRKKMDANNIKIIESTNSFYQLHYQYKDDKDDKLDTKDLFFTFNPDTLSVDKLQYFINTAKISILDDGNNMSINENTIILKGFKTGGQYRTGSSNEFIDIYESVDIPMISYKENLINLKEPFFKLFKSNVKRNNVENKEIEKLSELTEDVSWMRSIMDDLNFTNSEGKTNLERYKTETINETINENTKIFTCPDLNVDHTKLIIDELKKDGEEYVIIGYPNESMRLYLDLYNKNKEKFDEIYKDFKGTEHKDSFMQYMAELHNYIYDNLESPDPLKHINTDTQKSIESQIHKFYGYEDYYKYIANFYENELLKGLTPEEIDIFKKTEASKNQVNKEYGIKYDPEFQNKFKDLQKEFYNELASKCLNKPLMKINYVFLIFKKHTDDKYVPALFNFRELKNKHHSILLRLEYLIKTKLSQIYGIIEDGSTEDYKLWYSHYNYGDVFHIKTEYVHTMSNIQQQAYKYKNSISLEELIYMLSIPNVDLINLRLDYQQKKIKFSKINGIMQSQNLEKIKEITVINKCDKSLSKYKNTNSAVNEFKFGKHIKILLMFLETGKKYTFIYKNMRDNNFYILKFEPNLCNIYISIINYLIDNNLINNLKDELLKSNNNDLNKIIDINTNIKLYKITEHRPFTKIDYDAIVRYNPLLVREIKNIQNIPVDDNPISKTISVDMFFQSPLVNEIKTKSNYNMKIPNPYLKKPFLVRNFLATDTYKNEFGKFTELIKKNNNSTISYNYPINEIDDPNNVKNECSESRLGDELSNKYSSLLYEGDENKRKINRIFFNPGNCGYNFIEICEKIKSVVWIVPLNATYSDKIKDTNKNKENKDNKVIFNNVPKFLGNYANLNESHVPMLKQLNKLFNNEIYECFFNISSISPPQFSLHVHVFKKKNIHYNNPIAILQQGSRIDKFLNSKTVLNLLNLSKKYNYDYYNDYTENKYYINLLIHDKA
jgi:hypothetical protein